MKLCGFEAGLDKPLFLIAGPDTLESEQLCLDVAGQLKEHTAKLGMPYILRARSTRRIEPRARAIAGPAWQKV